MTRQEILKAIDSYNSSYSFYVGIDDVDDNIRDQLAYLVEYVLKVQASGVSDTNEPCDLAGVTNIHVANLSKHELNKMRELESFTLRIKSNNGIGSVVECFVDNEWVDITDYSCW